MADTRTELTLNRGTAVELDVLRGMLGQDVINIRTFGSKGVLIFDLSFTSTASYESKTTFINDDEGISLHRGFSIDQSATNSSYLEVCYILLSDEKPIQEQYDEFKTTMTRHTTIREQITHLFHAFHRDSHLMAVIYDITGALATPYHNSLDVDNPRHRGITAFHPPSRVPTTAVMCYKYSIGQPFVYPRNNLFYAGNFLNMVFFTPYEPYRVNPILERAMGHILTLYVNHEQNASTSTVCIAGSSGTNPFACTTAGIASLWGSMHGGASETALKMLEETSSVEHIPEFVRRVKDKNDSFHLMGFGHRVYKNYDPHVIIMHKTCHEVLKEPGVKNDLPEMAMELGNIALSDPYFIKKKLYPDVDFHSGIILKAMGIPSPVFTVIFIIACTVGWITHWSKMHSGGMKIARLRQLYIGYKKRDFKSNIRR